MATPVTAILFINTVFLFSLLPSVIHSDISSDRDALLALRSAVGGRSMQWNLTDINNPCSWFGVSCSADNSSVVELRLPGMGLSGIIPPNSISNLTGLQTLSLRYNSLSGPFPFDISSLINLRNLYLQNNQFSGPIPDFVFSLTNLVRLDIGENRFSGNLSASFNNLTRLRILYLENNNFSGSIPDLNLPGLVQFNVSNNQLAGPIPKGLAIKHPKNAFEGNSVCGQPLNDLCDNGVGNKVENKKKKGLSGGAIAGIVIGCVFGLLILVLIVLLLCRKRTKKLSDSREKDDLGGGFTAISAKTKDKEKNVVEDKSLVFFSKTGKAFNLDDLLRGSAEVLGKGTYGTAYKAGLEVGITVAVKRLRDVCVTEKEFKEKMEIIGGMNHENLVPLIAYYYNKDEKLLVYDYMPMGSLSALLHGNKGVGRTPLNWETRINIALGAVKGVSYLHSKSPSFSHGNIKSSNVLLTNTYESRVSDFGLAQLVAPSPIPNRIAGYRAPEVTDHRKVSQKADIYSLGVLLLELLTGKTPSQLVMNDEGLDLPKWVQSVVREEWTAEVFDAELLRYQNVEEDMVQLLQLAVDCTAQHPDRRPSIGNVVERIEELHRSSTPDRNFDGISDTDEKEG